MTELPKAAERTPEAIAARLRGVANIAITDDTTGQKHYGFDLGVGDNTLKSIWHCDGDNRKHPEHDEFVANGWDAGDLYCDSHYPSIPDVAALAFLINAREDIQALLALLGVQVELAAEEA